MSSKKSNTIGKSSGHGAKHWWHQRVTAVGLAALGLALIYCLVSTLGQPYEVAVERLKDPGVVSVVALFILFMFYHAALGLQVVIEDYVSTTSTRTVMILIVQLLCLLLAVTGTVSLISIMV